MIYTVIILSSVIALFLVCCGLAFMVWQLQKELISYEQTIGRYMLYFGRIRKQLEEDHEVVVNFQASMVALEMLRTSNEQDHDAMEKAISELRPEMEEWFGSTVITAKS